MKMTTKNHLLTAVGFLSSFTCLLLAKDVLANWAFWLALSAIVATTIFSIFCTVKNWDSFYKLTLTMLFLSMFVLLVASILTWTGFFSTFSSLEHLKSYIASTGSIGQLVFVGIQFLQVTLIPLPSTVVTIAGVALFGFWHGFVLSCVGQILGSVFAFAIARLFGTKLVHWIVGKELVNKYQSYMQGKDKIVITFMLLFPFFPDDAICLLAGLSSFSFLGFSLLVAISRPLTGIVTALLSNGALSIPLTGWWLVLWGFVALATLALFVFLWKNSEKIEKLAIGLLHKK